MDRFVFQSSFFRQIYKYKSNYYSNVFRSIVRCNYGPTVHGILTPTCCCFRMSSSKTLWVTTVLQVPTVPMWRASSRVSVMLRLIRVRSYVPRVLCSPGPMFPRTYVPRVRCSPILCSAVPMFPDTYEPLSYIPRYLCSPVPIFPGTYVPPS